jgi:hypothetical protein
MWKPSNLSGRPAKFGVCLLLCAVGAFAQALAGAGGSSQSPGQTPGSATPVRAHLRFEALLTTPNGATGAQRFESGTTVPPDGESTKYLFAGTGEDTDLCDNAGFSASRPATQPYYLWRLDSRGVEVSAGRTTFTVSWTRWRNGTEDASGARTVTLEPGEHHVLDFVPAPPGPARACVNLVLQVAADPVPQDDPQPMLAYDLWLLHEGTSGQRWSHERVYARSTTLAEFTLTPLSWSVAGIPLKGQDEPKGVRLGLTGSVRATLDPSGFVDVAVNARRTLTWRGLGGGEGGRQDYRARLGESVAIQLPEPTASTVVPGAARPKSVARGIEFKESEGVIHFGEFFADSRTSLVIVVSKAPGEAR